MDETMEHRFIEPKLLARIEGQEEKDGIDLTKASLGDKVTFETRNTTYEIEKAEYRIWLITGGKRWSGNNAKRRVYVVGSTFGGSVLKPDLLGEGMNVEICEEATHKVVITSPVVNLWEHSTAESRTT